MCPGTRSDGPNPSLSAENLMQAKLDHVVLWVADPLRSLDFYEKVVGLTPVRADEFREGKAPFPSVRVSSDSIIDLMARLRRPSSITWSGCRGPRGTWSTMCASRCRARTSKRCASGWLTAVSACRKSATGLTERIQSSRSIVLGALDRSE